MGDPALNLATVVASEPVCWPLRLSQRAFAALIEQAVRADAFRLAAQRQQARQTLSALSADDRSVLARWLALQLASGGLQRIEPVLFALTAVNPLLAAQVRTLLPRTVAELAPAARGAAA